MATACLFVGWNRPHVGREKEAWTYVMGEGMSVLDKFRAEGFIESTEVIGLTAHMADLNFFLLLFGERAKLDEMRRTDAFERFSGHMSGLFDGYGVVPGLNKAGLDLAMKRMSME
jgi:hypothetical protein